MYYSKKKAKSIIKKRRCSRGRVAWWCESLKTAAISLRGDSHPCVWTRVDGIWGVQQRLIPETGDHVVAIPTASAAKTYTLRLVQQTGVDASMRRTKNSNQGCALYCRSGACLFVYVSVCAWVSIWMNFSGGQTRARDDDAVPGKDWGPSVSQPDDDGWHDRWMDFGDQSDVMSGTQRKRES